MSASSSGPTVSWVPPGVGPRLLSSVSTSLASFGLLLGVGFVAFVVVGGIALLLLLLTGHGFDGIYFANPGDPSTEVQPDGLPTREPWPTWVVPLVVVVCLLVAIVAAVIGAARFGHGTVGDGVTGIETRRGDGSTPSRVRVIARVGLPVLVVLVLVARGSGPVVVLVAATLLWAPALAPGRRSLVDLLTGLHPKVSVEPKLGRSWDAMTQGGEGGQGAR
jgi:hypothetical protein